MKLTQSYPDDMAKKMQGTSPGMAHWAGTGPGGRTCRECINFDSPGYYATVGTLKKGTCRKYKIMMGKKGAKFEHRCRACMFFEINPKPPTVAKKLL